MQLSSLPGQKTKFRITLELNVMDDFNPHDVDWEKVLDIQGDETIKSYVEDLSVDVW
jgi:predicted component of type VI protein secretion system|tara:strand:+ start:4158 stop:4328 length:171 start_codon:yes stop_codon:yes gene_type:complete